MKDKNISYISILQIIGPIFVILGHSLNGLECTGLWYQISKEWIYIFHMPLFFMISGYLLAYKGYLGKRSYRVFVCEKAKRLLLPYVVWNLAFWIPKFFAQQYISDNATLNMRDMIKVFVFPRQNVWGHTWFLLGLFVVYLATPLFKYVIGANKHSSYIIVLIGAVFLYISPITTEFMAFSDIHKDLLFFIIGCILGQIEKDTFFDMMKRFRMGFIIGAIAFSVVAVYWYEETKILHFIPCTFILLSFLSLSVSAKEISCIWQNIATYSFGIYIMHWPIMIIVRIISHQILEVNVTVTALFMSIFGYAVPVIVITIIRALPLKRIRKPLKYLLGV
ncbi:MAG: acyltransferase [Tyzzerella sp.]|nr:acyltransferase [Tyzzerella sp.]